MEIPYGSTAAGAHVHTWPYDGLARQWWVRTTPHKSSTRIVNVGSGLCLGVAGGSTANQALLVQWPCNNSLDQQWEYHWQGYNHNGYPVYKIINAKSRLALDANWGKGADMWQYWDLPYNNNQLWY